MFTLRKEHTEAFAENYRIEFEERMVSHLRVRFPSQFDQYGEDKVRKLIWEGVERAKRYGIRAQPDVARFIRFMFAIGPDFDTARKTAWIRPILEDTSVPAADRLERIRQDGRAQRRASRLGQQPT